MKRIALVPLSSLLLVTSACRTGPERAAIEAAGAFPGESAQSEVTVRRLSMGSDYDGFAASSISPDGRYISFIDWSTYNLAVRDLRTGTVHHLTSNGGASEAVEFEGAGVSLFSPDGRRIVYGWQYGGVLQLRMMDFDPDEDGVRRTGQPTVLLNNPRMYPYNPFDWSPDGGQIVARVYLLPNGTGNQLALISTTDGTYKALKTFDWREPTRAVFSPDGRFVAYDFQPDPDVPNRDLFVVSVDGTYETRIVQDSAFDALLGWHPDGSILFQSHRGGTPGVWRVPVSDGKAAGPVVFVKADMWRIKPLGFAGDRFFYGVNAGVSRLYTRDVDLAGGAKTGKPVAVADRATAWGWSPDGKYLAYASDAVIVIRNDAGGEEVQPFRRDLGSVLSLRWSPDGNSIIVFASDDKGRDGFYRMDLETGSLTTIVRSDRLQSQIRRPGYFDVSADGRTLWFVTIEYRKTLPWQFDLVAYDIETGVSRNITPAEWELDGVSQAVARVAVSPDGSRLAVVAPDSSGNHWIGAIPVEGGPFTRLAPIGKDVMGGLEWTPDGNALVFSTVRDEDWPRGFRAWIVPASGGEVRQTDLVDDGSLNLGRYLKVHPQRARIAFAAADAGRQEIWVMEGLGSRVVAIGGNPR